MLMKKEKQNFFQRLVILLCKTSSINYIYIVGILVVIGAMCNYSSNKPLPMFWVLVAGFAFVIYMDIHSIRQSGTFLKQIEKSMAGDCTLRDQRAKLTKRFYSKRNWIIVFLVPTLILPAVIYIIRYPLGIQIKIFAYTALYLIIALCVISYSQYVYLIIFTYDLYKNAIYIKKYNHDCPHKTKWLSTLADTTNKQSNYFFITGTNFILLLSLITLSQKYDVSLESMTSLILVGYLWMLIIIGIVLMFTIFSLCSYYFVKLLIDNLSQKSISIYEQQHTGYGNDNRKQKYKELMILTEIKIMLLEQTPSYPHKPLVRYAMSYIVGAINFVATLESLRSLYTYFATNI